MLKKMYNPIKSFLEWRAKQPTVPFFSSWYPENRNWVAPEKPGPNASFREKFRYEWAMWFRPWF